MCDSIGAIDNIGAIDKKIQLKNVDFILDRIISEAFFLHRS